MYSAGEIRLSIANASADYHAYDRNGDNYLDTSELEHMANNGCTLAVFSGLARGTGSNQTNRQIATVFSQLDQVIQRRFYCNASLYTYTDGYMNRSHDFLTLLTNNGFVFLARNLFSFSNCGEFYSTPSDFINPGSNDYRIPPSAF